MIIAQQKKKENIAEYILYLFQIEDLIRAFSFDLEKINSSLVNNYQVDETTKKEIASWYENLVLMMQKEQIGKSGHLQFIKNHINELNEFHLKVVDSEASYKTLVVATSGLINEFRQKSDTKANDIETIFSALYGYMMLKIQKKQITGATHDAMAQFGKLLAHLSALFKEFEKGNIQL